MHISAGQFNFTYGKLIAASFSQFCLYGFIDLLIIAFMRVVNCHRGPILVSNKEDKIL